LRFHANPEGLFDSDCHIARERGALVEERGERGPRDAEDFGRGGDSEAKRGDDFVLDEIPWVRGIEDA
jgi:hypothetical protein